MPDPTSFLTCSSSNRSDRRFVFGLLETGDQLPTVRDVARELAINPNTVLKAYRELELEGLVDGRPGQGTFVLRSLAGRRSRTRPASDESSSGGCVALAEQGSTATTSSR